MTIALIDNGSLAPASHRSLRAAAEAVGSGAGHPVAAVSWKHSDRIPAAELDGAPAWTLAPWIRAQRSSGEREFVFVPFFISPQGAIGSALRSDLELLVQETGGFSYRFAEGLEGQNESPLATIAEDRIRQTIAEKALRRPAVIVVDHGGPAAASAAIRNRVAAQVRDSFASEIGPLAAASLESPEGPEYAFNRPLFADQLGSAGFALDVVVAPLFLSPGRHAGPGGDLARIARSAESRTPGLRCHFTGLVGTHPLALSSLALSLKRTLEPAFTF